MEEVRLRVMTGLNPTSASTLLDTQPPTAGELGSDIMPEHVHLLISEPPAVLPAKVIQVFKQRVSRRMRGKKRSTSRQLSLSFGEVPGELRRFWQRRYYDFNLYSRVKRWEKLHYMHANPVEERLVKHPLDWPWSSWSHYAKREEGLIRIDSVEEKKSGG